MADLDAIMARLERLEAENAALRQTLDGFEHRPAAVVPGDLPMQAAGPVSRRSLLGAGTAAVAATVLSALALPAGAAAANPPVLLNQDNVANGTTSIQGPSSGAGFTVDSGAQPAIWGTSASGIGLFGVSGGVGVSGRTSASAGFGVEAEGPYVGVKGRSTATGTTNGSGVGVFGTSRSDDGAGVDGRGPNIGVHGQSPATGVLGKSTSGGIGVLGNSDTYRAVVGIVSADTGQTIGVMGESFSAQGTGVRGWAAGDANGVYGFSGGSFPSGAPPARTGVCGNAPKGRGVVASGGQAQLRLVPSSASSHPSTGAAGDLFLDKVGRLWFCKGGTTWKQLA